MRLTRLFYNLGLKTLADAKKAEIEINYLSPEEKKTELEKIKALKDPSDNLSDRNVNFSVEEALEPNVLESTRKHQGWLTLANELMRWGEFVRAKELYLETNLHSRILKD